MGQLLSRLENNIAGMLVIKSFTAEAFELKRVEKASDAYRKANMNAIRLNVVYVPLIRMIVALGFAGVLLVGSYWILTDQPFLTIGELVLFSMLIQRVLWPLTRMGVTLDAYERAKASARRIQGLLTTPSTIQDKAKVTPPGDTSGDRGRLSGKIDWKDIQFGYQEDLPVLDKLSFNIQPGEMVGIAGTTGCGKSTLVKLLLRLYEPTGGTLLIDNRPIESISLNVLRKEIALVSQDVYLFYGTIYENIAYGHEGRTLEQIQYAAKMADLDSFVQTLPEGYNTVVGERGMKLSGGQRQRLSIARAILKDAPIMIFDEATSSVDTETEKTIKMNLEKIVKGRTSIIIAHRLSTIRHADRILVMHQGRIINEGPHNVLIKDRGFYYDLWQTQLGEIES